ncbi:MAG: metal ABC transporter substrate-binding protein [Bacillota bacterium]
MHRRSAARFVLLAMILNLATLSGAGCVLMETAPGVLPARVVVVASIYPLASIVQSIGKDNVEVVTLVPAGASPHTFEVTPQQVKNFARADLFVKVGAGLDLFAEKLVSAQSSRIRVVTVTDGLEMLRYEYEELEEDAEAHEHGELDPHVWLDPLIVKEHIAPKVAAALAEIRPELTGQISENLREFQADIDRLHAQLEEMFRPHNGRCFISLHAAWGYLASRYNLRTIVVQEFPAREPSAGWIARLVDLAKREGVSAVVVEPQFSPKAAQIIAGEVGAQVVTLDPLGGPDLQGYQTYSAMMMSNAISLVRALKKVAP